jgi:hypothetical protein
VTSVAVSDVVDTELAERRGGCLEVCHRDFVST